MCIRDSLKTESRNIAQVFQFPVIYNTMTVYENLAFPLKCRDFSQNKIDITVMLGYKFYNLINIFAGPRFEYIGKVEFESLKIDDLKNKFKTGLQYGIGVKFGNIEVDVRAERSFTKNEIKFMQNQIGEKNQYVSTQGKLYLLGISYYF